MSRVSQGAIESLQSKRRHRDEAKKDMEKLEEQLELAKAFWARLAEEVVEDKEEIKRLWPEIKLPYGRYADDLLQDVESHHG